MNEDFTRLGRGILELEKLGLSGGSLGAQSIGAFAVNRRGWLRSGPFNNSYSGELRTSIRRSVAVGCRFGKLFD